MFLESTFSARINLVLEKDTQERWMLQKNIPTFYKILIKSATSASSFLSQKTFETEIHNILIEKFDKCGNGPAWQHLSSVL